MKKSLIIWAAVGLFVLITVSSLIGSYNGLVTGNQTVTTAWASVETQYQRRYDLIPNLVEATKGVLRQEQTVFKDIADARTHYAGTQPGSSERVAATGQVDSALSRLLVVMENYPQLKSDQTVQNLMFELSGTENRIQVARDRYNEQVRTWNSKVKSFPTVIMANMFHYDAKPYFEADQSAQKATNVNLSL